MVNYQLISSILSGTWMIDRVYAESHLPFILSLLNGKFDQAQDVKRSGYEKSSTPYAIDPKTMQQVDIYERDEWGYPIGIKQNLPSGLVGILPMQGAITKYDVACGGAGMITRNNSMIDFQNMDAIGSIVLLMDTPGGETSAAQPFTDAIKNSSKPVVAFIDGLCASMGMWYASAAKEAYASTDMATIGSIGTYTTLADFTGMYDKEGIKLHTIYAPQSTDKNKTYRDVLDGKEEGVAAMQQELADLTDIFINQVATSRPQAAANIDQWNTGKTFHSQEAKKIGLIDGVMPLNKAIARAAFLGRNNF